MPLSVRRAGQSRVSRHGEKAGGGICVACGVAGGLRIRTKARYTFNRRPCSKDIND